MKRLRAKARPRRRYTAYRGRGRLESWGFLLAGVLALIGLVMSLVRSWGMRFSGFLLLGAAALLTADLLFSRWARRSSIGWSCRFAFRAALALVLVPLSILEICIIHEGQKPPAERDAAAVVVLGAGVNGKEPSLSLRTRLDAALTYLEGHPEIPAVLTGGTGYGEEAERPSLPASRKREGRVPTIKPMKSQVVTVLERQKAAEIPLANPKKPAHQPSTIGTNIFQYFGTAVLGRVSTSINGR